ncbi:MAG: hypothetical protein PHV36_03430 [Elusimicrobiales bacterium]|nr:hypothetical protein [Elusimicrobiales bacterium]
MKNRILGGFIALTLLAGTAGAWAQAQKQEKKTELTEKTGVISVQKADPKKNEKYDTILLKAGEESIKLLPGADKKVFKPLEKLAGKTVTVKGEYLPPNPPKYPLAALKVASFAEVKAAPAAAKK